MEILAVDFDSNKLNYVNINSLIYFAKYTYKLLPSVQIKKLSNEGKLYSSEVRSLQEFCSQYNVDETACKSHEEHLEFLDAKAKKRVRERNSLPSNFSWKNEKDVEALTNN